MNQQEEMRALIRADDTLCMISVRMEHEFAESGISWPRDRMRKHASERAAILTARNVILDRLDVLNAQLKDALLSGGPHEVTTPKPEPVESLSGAPSVTSNSGGESAESPAAS